MDLADIKIGDNVLLQGCGAIGSIILNMLLLKGGANVTVSDPIAEKRETALKLGAQYVIDPKNEDLKERAMEITNGRGYDVRVQRLGIGDEWVEHGTPGQLYALCGYDEEGILRALLDTRA